MRLELWSVVFAASLVGCGGPEPAVGPAPAASAAGPVVAAPVSVDAGAAEASAAPATSTATTAPSFADDLAFLTKHGPVHLLAGPGGARVAVSAKYQGRVMTSAVDARGQSFGWINRSFIDAAKTGTQFDNYGGEDRFWLGPEGGQFGLYFPPGKPFAFDTWQVPGAMQEGAWETSDATPLHVTLKRSMTVTNWTGTTFTIDVERTISLVEVASAGAAKAVAYETVNKITNKGKAAWKRDTGLPSIWILAMFAPSPDARVIVPFETAAAKGTPIVNDAYFGKVPAERLAVHDAKGFLVFTCDGQQRGKIGVGPARAKPMLGSYSAQANLLTVIRYDKPRTVNPPYVNSMWEKQKLPYSGDVVNSYNDGSPGPGKPPLGGFYEIETSSPGAELQPGQSLVHTHRTTHFVGEQAALEPLAKEHLGVSLADVR